MPLCQSIIAVAHLWSVHSGSVPNADTFGAGIECQNPGYSAQAGDFRNSLGRNSLYAVVGHDWSYGPLSAGLFAGVASGYNYRPANPIAGARVAYSVSGYTLQAVLMPPGPNTPACVHLMVGFRLK